LLVLWAVPGLVLLAGAGSALIGKEAFKWFTGEDRFAENMQVLFYVLALGLSLVATRRVLASGRIGIGALYVVVCCGLVFLIGEEMSWGQRIFGWETPEQLKASNKQEETNLHNVYGVGAAFKWIQLLVGAYGAILPLAVRGRQPLGLSRQTVSLLVPHFTLVPYFATMFAWRLYRNLFDPPRRFYFVVQDYNEVLELVLAIGMFLFMLYQVRALKPASANLPIKQRAAAHAH
jgi:hypothetical protein